MALAGNRSTISGVTPTGRFSHAPKCARHCVQRNSKSANRTPLRNQRAAHATTSSSGRVDYANVASTPSVSDGMSCAAMSASTSSTLRQPLRRVRSLGLRQHCIDRTEGVPIGIIERKAFLQVIDLMVGPVGFEPTTKGL